MRVAICARYSSENRRDASIADQFRVCGEFARRQGWQVAAEYSDHAVSGATIMRPGFQAMMREALQKKFDIVMAEALDRFSRDQEDTAGLFKRLTFAGVNIVTLADNRIYTAQKTELVDLLTSLVIMSRAHEESQTKSLRVGAAWANKRANAKAKPLTASVRHG